MVTKRFRYAALLLALASLVSGCGESELGDKASTSVNHVKEVAELDGRDDNKNGIRDDIEPWIQATGGDNDQLKSALGALAIAHQRFILAHETHQANHGHSLYQLAVRCLFYLEDYENGPSVPALMKQVKTRITDNTTRLDRHTKGFSLVQDKILELGSSFSDKKICTQLRRAVPV